MTNDPYDGKVGDEFVPKPDAIPTANEPKPGPSDPRMSKEYVSSIMHPRKEPKMHSSDPVQARPETMNSLLERLERVNSYIAGHRGNIISINDSLTGPVPQEQPDRSSAHPNGALTYAHSLVDEMMYQLDQINGELERTHRILGV